MSNVVKTDHCTVCSMPKEASPEEAACAGIASALLLGKVMGSEKYVAELCDRHRDMLLEFVTIITSAAEDYRERL